MPSTKELRDELRALRKDSVKPVSRMRKEDISKEIEKLKGSREETAPVASTPMGPIKASKSAVETIKEAKRTEFPVQPADEKKKSGAKSMKSAPKPSAGAVAGKKKSKLAKLLALMDETESETE